MYILRCLSGEPDAALVFDSDLRSQVRRLLTGLEGNNDNERAEAARKVLDLYAIYGPGVWKCILELSYLLHTTSEAREMFGAVLDRLETDIQSNRHLALELVKELGWFARTPYDFTSALVKLSLARLARCSSALSTLIGNPEADRLLRLNASQEAIAARNQSTYDSILQFFAEVSKDQSAETYARVVIPLVDLYSQTNASGLNRAVDMFESKRLGRHGPFLLSSFRSVFATWFLTHLPKASVQWAAVLLMAWRNVDNSTARNTVLSVLIDDWCSNPGVAQFVRRKLLQKLREDRRYLAPASRHLQARVLEFAKPRPGQAGKDFEDHLREVLLSEPSDWSQRRAELPLDRATGLVAAKIYSEADDEIKNRISEWIEQSSRRTRFQRSFFGQLVKPHYFAMLGSTTQLRVIRSSAFVKNVTSRELDSLCLESHRFEPRVDEALKEALLAVLHHSGISTLDTLGGRLDAKP